MNITRINELLHNANPVVGKQPKAPQTIVPCFQSILDEAKLSGEPADAYDCYMNIVTVRRY